MTRLRRFVTGLLRHRYGATLWIFLIAAAITGGACVLFMWAFEWVLNHRLDFQRVGGWCWLTTPLLFLLAVELIRRLAPSAAGTGIPQTIHAAEQLTYETQKRLAPLVSAKTMLVKVATLLIGVWACASTGREGPTVHVAACLFFSMVLLARRWTGLNLDLRSAVIAGGAAGLAAAFNTPLAGVTFAIEELSSNYFVAIKDFVLIAIIVAGLAAKSLTGEYTYFGRLLAPAALPVSAIFLIGIGVGGAGAFFTSVLMRGKHLLDRFQRGTLRYLLPVLFAWLVLACASVAGANVLGPGNKPAQLLVDGQYAPWAMGFPVWKMAATLFTYWSGIAGGIFAPSLSMGATLGGDVAHGLGWSIASCALVGMAAFLSGAIQAPITAFVIIFEMTGHHQLLLPVMLASLLGSMTARVCGAKHFYQSLADEYHHLVR